MTMAVAASTHHNVGHISYNIDPIHNTVDNLIHPKEHAASDANVDEFNITDALVL